MALSTHMHTPCPAPHYTRPPTIMRRPISIVAALLIAAPFIHVEVAASASSSLSRFMDGEIPLPADWNRKLEEAGESMPQSYLFTGAPTVEPTVVVNPGIVEIETAAPTAVAPKTTSAPTPAGEADVASVEPTAAPSAVAMEEEATNAPTPSPSVSGSDGEVDAQGGNPSVPPPPAGTGGDAGAAAGGDGAEVPTAPIEPEAPVETPAVTPEASVEASAPTTEEVPAATPASTTFIGDAMPVTTIVLELAGTTAQKLEATNVILAEVERVLKTEATYSSARRVLVGSAVEASSSSSVFSPSAKVRRALQTAGALCASTETPHSTVTITLTNYGDEAAASALLDEIVAGNMPLALTDGTALRDTICKEEVSLKMIEDAVKPLDDGAKDSEGGSGLGSDAIIAIAVLGPATVLFFIFFAYRRRSNSRVAQV